MKTMNEAISILREALLTVTNNASMYEANDATISHIVYGVDTESSRVSSDNEKEIQGLQGTIDLFALRQDRHMAAEIQSALNDAKISFYLNSIQYEDYELNNFLHYEWVFEVS